jgi:hypothetical protein
MGRYLAQYYYMRNCANRHPKDFEGFYPSHPKWIKHGVRFPFTAFAEPLNGASEKKPTMRYNEEQRDLITWLQEGMSLVGIDVDLQDAIKCWPISCTRAKELDRVLRNPDSPQNPLAWNLRSSTLGQPHLAFEACDLTDSCIPEIADLLQSSASTPRHLSFRDNALGNRGVRQLSDALWMRLFQAEPADCLEELDISGTYFDWPVRSSCPGSVLWPIYHRCI